MIVISEMNEGTLQKRVDAKFKRMGVKPCVYHFNDHTRRAGGNPHRIWAFSGITIATLNPGRTHIEDIVLKQQEICGIYYNAASDTLKGLRAHNIYGVAICDLRDQFSRPRGRIIAEGRLLLWLQQGKS